jgi:hypothetical protein
MLDSMRRSIGARTIDGAASLRCMVVGLSEQQVEDCRKALVPVEVVPTATVRDACTSMSMVLPLVVIVDDQLSDADRAALSEMTTACGAEIVALDEDPPGKGFSAKLLEALRVAERRRLGMR